MFCIIYLHCQHAKISTTPFHLNETVYLTFVTLHENNIKILTISFQCNKKQPSHSLN